MILQVRTLVLYLEKIFMQMKKQISYLLMQKFPRQKIYFSVFWGFCFTFLTSIHVINCMSMIFGGLIKITTIL